MARSFAGFVLWGFHAGLLFHAEHLGTRKPVFLSKETRDRLDRIVRLFGERKMSVSGLTENIVRRHLEIYEKEIDEWRKL